MQKNDQNFFTGIEVGSSATRVVIGSLDNETSLVPTIVGVGVAANSGMRKGNVVHIDEVANSIAEALASAERMSGAHVEGATVSLDGAHLSGTDSRGIVAISSSAQEVTGADVARVEEAATAVKIPLNQEIVQIFARSFKLDGQDAIKNPVGMSGVRLELDAHIVTGAANSIRNLEAAFEKANVEINNKIINGLAAAEALLDRRSKESGCALIDIGQGTTNIVVFDEAEVQHVSVLPVGGGHITNDIAIGLKADIDTAEKIKLEHASLLPKDQTDKELSHQNEHEKVVFTSEQLGEIVGARLEELFSLVDREFKKIGRSKKLPGGIYITGGTANIPGTAELAKEVFALPSRVAHIKSDISSVVELTDRDSLAAAIGLMYLDMHLPSMNHQQSSRSSRSSSASSKAKNSAGKLKGMLSRFRA
jgi:cell division protein FtsA